VHGLNIVGVIVARGAAHAAGTDVVGHDVAVIGEFLPAEWALSVLQSDFAVQQLPRCRVGARFEVSTRVVLLSLPAWGGI